MEVRLELLEGTVTVDAEVAYVEPRIGFAVRFLNVAFPIRAELAAAVAWLFEHRR